MKAVIFYFVALFASALAVPRTFENFDIELPVNDEPVDDRLYGGKETNIEDCPYQLSFRMKGRHQGGASVLTPTRGLTAAHHIDLTKPMSRFSIKAGATYHQDRDSTGQIRPISRYIRHPKYGGDTHNNDITVLQWEEPLVFGASVQPVVIPSPNFPIPYGKMVVTSGWGFFIESWLPKRLHSMETPLVTDAVCNKTHGSTNREIKADQICAGNLLGGQGICNADNGGPMVYKLGKKYVQLGVVSWSYGCGEKGFPDVYARVPYFSAWIRKYL